MGGANEYGVASRLHLLAEGEGLHGRLEGRVIDDVLISRVGLLEGGAQQSRRDARDAAADPEEQLDGGVRQQLVARAGGLDAVLDEGLEVVAL